MSATVAEAGLDAILWARAVIARFGERDVMAWWDDESLMPSGAFVMNRLFPRTAAFAQTEVAIEAATLRHQTLVPQAARVTLFRLPPLLESTVRQRLLSLKREGGDQLLKSLASGIDVQQSLAEVLVAAGVIDSHNLDAIRAMPVTGNTLALGTLQAGQMDFGSDVSTIVQRLAAGYTLGSRGNIVIPYYETSP